MNDCSPRLESLENTMVSENTNGAPSPGMGWNLGHPAVFLATGFGVGLLPRAPGTWGSLLAVGLAWGIVYLWGPLALALGGLGAERLGAAHDRDQPKSL